MKRLLIALAIIAFFCVGGHAQLQRPQVLPQRMPYSYYQFTGYLQADSGLLLPQRVANFTPKRAALIYDTGAARIRFYLDGWKSIQDVAFTRSYRNLVDTPTNVTTQGNTFNGALQLLQLDNAGKVYFANLPSTLMTYKGTWSAATNTPALTDGTGVSGWMYQAIDSGVVDFGSGPITFFKNDYVGYNGSIWQWSPGNPGVRSVNGFQNIVNLTTVNIPEGGSVLYWTAARSRAAQSVTATGLTYDNSTGVISLTTGYTIPLTTDLSNWNTAYSWGNWAAGSHYIGTTLIANNRASASQTLTGVSIDGNAGTVTNGVYTTTFNTLGDARYLKLTGGTLSGGLNGTSGAFSGNLSAIDVNANGSFILAGWNVMNYSGTGSTLRFGGITAANWTRIDTYAGGAIRTILNGGDFTLGSTSGVGTGGLYAGTISGTSLTVSGQVDAGSLYTHKAASNSPGNGPYVQWGNDANRYWLAQLNTGLGIDWWFYDGSIWTAPYTFRYDGVLQTKRSVEVYRDGSNTIGLGAYFQLSNQAGDRTWVAQLNASNNIDFWYYNGSAWINKQTFANDGSVTISNLAGTGNVIVGSDNSGKMFKIGIGSGLSFNSSTNILSATGGSSGTITGSGTSGYIPLWNSASDIGNSVMSQSGTVITVAGSIVATSFTAISMPAMGANTKYFTMYDAVAGGELKYATVANVQSYLGLGPAAYLNANLTSFTNDAGFITNSTSSLVNYYTATNIQNFFSGASAITGYNYSNWNTAYSWGNHAGLYLLLTGGTLTGALNGTTAYFTGTVTAGSFFEIPSDIRKKEVVQRWISADGMDAIAYYLKNDPAKKIMYGFEAQQVTKVLPTAVATHEDKTMPDGITYSVGYTQVLVYKIAMLEKRIENLENWIKK